MAEREAVVNRETAETKIKLTLNIDGTGKARVKTGIGMLNHLLSQVARHGLFDLSIEARGDLHVNQHHTVEDIAISLGRAFKEALGERWGIARMGHALVPMDEALALVAVDFGGRGYCAAEVSFEHEAIGELQADLIGHFLDSLAHEARLNLHARLLAGTDEHHKAEALFKALGRALDMATKIDERLGGEVPSTKGTIERA